MGSIPKSIVPDTLMLTSSENRLDLTVTANTGNVKWIAFT